MSRILEFQPTDEHTVVSRVLVELHQAIDSHFPGVNASARQFTKTVLTNQGESTRVDNTPASGGSQPNNKRPQKSEQIKDDARLSMTPQSSHRKPGTQAPLMTADIKTLMGESFLSRQIKKILLALLLVGLIAFIWLTFFRNDMPAIPGM